MNRVTVNGQMASGSTSSTSSQDDGQSSTWKIGLINQHGKYLTAETFGFTINAAGTSLRRKQLWTIEHDLVDDETVYIRSHLGRYLAGDRKVNCSAVSYYGSLQRAAVRACYVPGCPVHLSFDCVILLGFERNKWRWRMEVGYIHEVWPE